MNTTKKSLLGLALSAGLFAATATPVMAANWCEGGNTIKFAGLNWESGMLLTDIMQFVLKHGYDCETDSLPGNSITMEQALANNDIQVFAEEWIGRSDAWNKAESAGKVVAVGAPIVGATEGWYVPRFVVDGDKARGIEASAPELKSITDLGQYSELFRDAEEPDKGRFYNCPAGWTCELDNSEMLKKYGLEDKYTNFRPGTGPALDAAVLSSYKRKEPILFYYWSPTPLLGQVDVIKLEEPGVNKDVTIQVGLSKTFSEQAPELVSVLEKVNLPIDMLNQSLAKMAKEKMSSEALAKEILKEHPELWRSWVSDSAASKIEAAL